jgi:hypothetical protein
MCMQVLSSTYEELETDIRRDAECGMLDREKRKKDVDVEYIAQMISDGERRELLTLLASLQ